MYGCLSFMGGFGLAGKSVNHGGYREIISCGDTQRFPNHSYSSYLLEVTCAKLMCYIKIVSSLYVFFTNFVCSSWTLGPIKSKHRFMFHLLSVCPFVLPLNISLHQKVKTRTDDVIFKKGTRN